MFPVDACLLSVLTTEIMKHPPPAAAGGSHAVPGAGVLRPRRHRRRQLGGRHGQRPDQQSGWAPALPLFVVFMQV
jgi:hypothetical protein